MEPRSDSNDVPLPACPWRLHSCSERGAFLLPREISGCFQWEMFMLFPFKVSFFSSSVPIAQNCIFSPNKRNILVLTRVAERMVFFSLELMGFSVRRTISVHNWVALHGQALQVSGKLERSLGRLCCPGSRQGIAKHLVAPAQWGAASELLGDLLCSPPAQGLVPSCIP